MKFQTGTTNSFDFCTETIFWIDKILAYEQLFPDNIHPISKFICKSVVSNRCATRVSAFFFQKSSRMSGSCFELCENKMQMLKIHDNKLRKLTFLYNQDCSRIFKNKAYKLFSYHMQVFIWDFPGKKCVNI